MFADCLLNRALVNYFNFLFDYSFYKNVTVIKVDLVLTETKCRHHCTDGGLFFFSLSVHIKEANNIKSKLVTVSEKNKSYLLVANDRYRTDNECSSRTCTFVMSRHHVIVF